MTMSSTFGNPLPLPSWKELTWIWEQRFHRNHGLKLLLELVIVSSGNPERVLPLAALWRLAVCNARYSAVELARGQCRSVQSTQCYQSVSTVCCSPRKQA